MFPYFCISVFIMHHILDDILLLTKIYQGNKVADEKLYVLNKVSQAGYLLSVTNLIGIFTKSGRFNLVTKI